MTTNLRRWLRDFTVQLWALTLLLIATCGAAHAHSVTVGYVITGPNTITVYYGAYHGTVAPEGIVVLTGPVTLSKVVGGVVRTKPAGLIDGVTNFYAGSCSGGSLSTPNAWESATFTGVPDGYYSIQLTGSFSINWQPCDASISSGSTQFLVDTTPPAISNVPANITVYTAANSSTAAATWSLPSATDAVGVASFSSNVASGTQFPVGTTTVTYTARDAAGNTSTASFTVTVIDNVPPVIANVPANITLTPVAGSPAIATWALPTATDNVGVASLTSDFASGASFPPGVTTVTYTAVDAGGNPTTASFTVTVIDTTAPVIGCPANQTVQATGTTGAIVTWAVPTVTDNSGPVTPVGSHSPGATFPIGSTTVTYTATDPSGNASSCSFNIVVQDSAGPTFSGVPTNITIEATSPTGATYTYALPTATDAVTGSSPVTTSLPSGSTFLFTGPGPTATTVTFTAADTASPPNTATAQFTVTVVDSIPPTLAGVPSNIVIEATGPSGAVATYTPATVTDIADAAPTLTYSQASGTNFPIGTTTVTVTGRDASNNVTTSTFTVTVRDSTPPTLSGLPANATALATGPTGAVVTYVMPTGVDTTSATLVTTSHPSGSTFPVGVTTVTFTATDAAGNITTGSFQVTVIDGSAPTFANVPTNITIEATGPTGAAVNYVMPTANDVVVGPSPVTSSHPPGTIFPVGTTTVTFTTSDTSAPPNTATATFQVIVRDTTAPVIGAVSDVTATAGDLTGALVTFPMPTATDVTDPAPTVTTSPAAGTLFPIGVHTVTATATDAAGNQSTRTFTVTVLSPAQLSVTPANGLVSQGPQGQLGAPFTPTSQVYVVTNNGQVRMDFTVTGTPAWASASPASATLAPGAATNVTVALTAAADAMPIGSHTEAIAFTNVTGGIGSTTRPVTLNVTAPATLVMGPATTFVASGPQGGVGGSFTPTTTTYTLQNTGSSPMDFTVSGQPSWLTVSSSSGTVPAGGSVTITVAINAGANALPIGTASGALSFTNTTNNLGTTTRPVSLIVQQPARLTVMAADGLVASGNQGGSFAPATKTYTLSNTGGAPLSFTVSDDRGWMDVAAASGTIPAGGSTTVTVSVNALANTLASGTYNGTVTFTNVSSAVGNTTRPVNLTVIPKGQVIFKVTTTEGDGIFKFTSPTAALAMSLATVNGSAQSAPLSLNAGVYTVSSTPPDGFGFTSISCSDNDSSGSAATRSATIQLAAAETVICTFASANSRQKTTDVIQKFMARRNDLLLSNGPDAGRQIDRLLEAGEHAGGLGASRSEPQPHGLGASRLSGEAAGSVGSPTTGRPGLGSTALGAHALNSASAGQKVYEERGPSRSASSTWETAAAPTAWTGANQDESSSRVALSGSLSQMMRMSAESEKRKVDSARATSGSAEPGSDRLPSSRPLYSPFDFWFQGQFTRFSDGTGNNQADGHFGVLHIGADYIFNPKFLLGVQAQFDTMRLRSTSQAYEIEGKGWMIGPYTTIRLSEHLFLQARAAAGQSSNTVSPYLTYTDNFVTTRWLASATLVGRWQVDKWQFRPAASVSFIQDVSKAYVDSLGVNIPSVKSSLGQFKIGPEVSYQHVFESGWTIEPRAGLQAIWNFASDGNGADFGGSLAGPKEIRGRAELGLKVQTRDGVGVDLSGSYDGIGSKSYQALSGKATVRIPLN